MDGRRRRRAARRRCRSTSSISRRPPSSPTGRRRALIDRRRSPATCRPAVRISVAPGDVAEGAHLRALRGQHLPDHPAAGRRSRRSAGHRGRHDQGALSSATCRSRASISTRSSSGSSSSSATRCRIRGHRRVRRRPDPHRDGVGRREEPRPRVGARGTSAAVVDAINTRGRPVRFRQRLGQPARSRRAAQWSGHPDGAVFRPARRRRHRRSRRATRSSCGPIRGSSRCWARCRSRATSR